MPRTTPPQLPERRSATALSVAMGAVLLGCSCSHTSQHGHAEAHEGPSTGAPSASARASATGPREPVAAADGNHEAPAPDPRIERREYELARHLERAELRQGDTLVMDFGPERGHQYDFGGWLSGAGTSRVIDGTSALLVHDKRVRLALPVAQAGPVELSLCVRGFAASGLTVYVNGKTVSDARLSGKAFEVHRIALPAERVHVGENELMLRTSHSGAVPGGGRSGLAIDWIRVGPEGLSADDAAPPGGEVLSPRLDLPELHVPAGYAVDYTLEVPEGARLRAAIRPSGAGSATIVAHVDGRAPVSLLERALPDSVIPIDLDLSALSGQVTRISLSASGQPLKLVEPRVVTLVEPQQAASVPKIENVLVILIDTLRADKLSPYNPETRVKTPGLSTFLRHAAVLENARSQENWTKPSVATLLSSLLPWEHNAVEDASRVPESVELLPELLRKRGFYTGSFIANGYVSDKFGFHQGWHTYRNYIREGRKAKAQFVAADVLDWLDRRPKDKPFFLYMHTIDPHVPYKPPQSFLSMYDPDEGYNGPVNFRASSTLLENIKIGKLKLNGRDKERLTALYDAEISYHDVHFAAVLEGLEKRGLADNTMVVVTADHGEEFWDHGSVGHGHSVYDELLHIPMIVRIPGLTHGALRVHDAVGLVDVMPTILEALGQEVPDTLSGKSFLPQLRREVASAPRTAVSGFMSGWRTLAVGRLKLVQRTLAHTWLYDIETDPGETTDVAAQRPIALRYARGLLGLALANQDSVEAVKRKPRERHKRQNVEIDATTQAQLEALGYVGSSKPN